MLKAHPLSDGRQVILGGWKKQEVDERDEHFSLKLSRPFLGANPSSVDLRPYCSAVENQGSIGSCTANAFAALIEASENRRVALAKADGALPQAAAAPVVTVGPVTTAADGTLSFQTLVSPAKAQSPSSAKRFIEVSRLFHYYATRILQGTVDQDSGATLRNTLKAGAKYGVLEEALWAYNPAVFRIKPPDLCWKKALEATVTSYHAIADGDVETMKSALASGFLVAFGFSVYDSFMSDTMAKTALLCRPKKGERLLGGHAVALVGYDDKKRMPDGSVGAFLVRNSWGPAWGDKGYFWMASNYVGDKVLSQDFWVVQASPF